MHQLPNHILGTQSIGIRWPQGQAGGRGSRSGDLKNPPLIPVALLDCECHLFTVV